MNIHYLAPAEHLRSRALYEEVFVEDPTEFVDAYYQKKAPGNQILVAEEEGQIVSMLHRNPYDLCLRGEIFPADYIVAVATKVTYRHQGLMRALLTRALQDMSQRCDPFTFLMPADEAIYTPFDFRLMGNDDEEGLADKTSAELAEDYDLYIEKDENYRKRHIDWPEWETTPMMVRITHLPSFLCHIGAEEPQQLTIAVIDPILPANNGTFLWSFTEEGSTLQATKEKPQLTVSIADLGSFLFGMLGADELMDLQEKQEQRKMQDKAQPCESLEEKLDKAQLYEKSEERTDKAQLCGKLEKIRVINGSYINETV